MPFPKISTANMWAQHCSGTVSRGPSSSSRHIPGCIPVPGLSRTTRMAAGHALPGSPGALDLQGPSAAGGSAGGTIYLVNFRGRRFNCFKLLLEKLEWSTINQADLPPRAHPPRAGNQLPPRDLLLMNFAAPLISLERRSPASPRRRSTAVTAARDRGPACHLYPGQAAPEGCPGFPPFP